MRSGARRVGYVVTIIVNFILLFVFNNLLNWRVPFLTESFVTPLLFFNASFAAGIIGNALFLIYDARWIRHIVQIILNVISFAAIYVLFNVFPFNFPSELWDLVAQIVLILTLVGISIGTIVEVVRLFMNKD